MAVDIIKIPNFADVNQVTIDELASDVASAQATATLLNTNNFANNDYVAFNPGIENGEMLKVQSISGQILTMTSNFLQIHRKRERVVKLYGNNINVYTAVNVDGTIPPDTSFAKLGTIAILPMQPFTIYTNNSGGAGLWYKFTYYNDVSTNETGLDLAVATRGGGYGHYVSIEDIKTECGIKPGEERISDSQIEARRTEAESEIKGKLSSAGYTMPLQTQTGAYYVPPTVENIARLLTAGYILQMDFGLGNPGSTKNGQTKQELAQKMLAELQLTDTILLDTNEQQMAKEALVSGYPDDSTQSGGPDGTPEPSFFTMSKKL